MRVIAAFFTLWIGLILQSTVFQIPPFDVIHPDFVLVALIMVALVRGSKTALVLGVLIGFFQDVDYGSFLGLNAFAYGVVGYFAAAAFTQFLHRNVAITFLVTVVFTFVHVWITYGMTRMFDVTAFTWNVVMMKSLSQMLVNGIVLLMLYPLLLKWFTDRKRSRYSESDADTSTT